MAFTFNPEDVKFASSLSLEFGGVYNVIIEDAKETGQAINGADKMSVKFVVEDGEYKGATINHFFMDDSEVTTYNPFRYREIAALVGATGVVQANQAVTVATIAPALVGKRVSVTIGQFEETEGKDKNTGAKKTYYNPRITDLKAWQAVGSQVDKSIVKPKAQSATPASGNAFSSGAPLPPEPQADAFGGGF